MITIDTDVLIWYFRGNEKANETITSIGRFSISSIVYMELLQGIRNKKELSFLKQFITNHEIQMIHPDHEISSRAIYFIEKSGLSNSMRLADAMIASTADIRGEALLTGNAIHYRFIPSLTIKKFSPS